MTDARTLTEKTTIKINVVAAIVVLTSVASGGWFASEYFNRWIKKFEARAEELKETVSPLQRTMWDLQAQLKRESQNRWSVSDMIDYGRELRASNMPVTRADASSGLVIPDAREIHENNL